MRYIFPIPIPSWQLRGHMRSDPSHGTEVYDDVMEEFETIPIDTDVVFSREMATFEARPASPIILSLAMANCLPSHLLT